MSSQHFFEKLEFLTVHKIWDYPILTLVLVFIFLTIFKFGDYFSEILNSLFEKGKIIYESALGVGTLATIIWGGFEGIIAGLTVALPYIVPFYIILGLLEDSGYLSRIAFLTDNLMHKMGLHGKAIIPIILGYGCNVPAVLGCRIMETQRERYICGFCASLIPCAARTVIILGLVGKFVGMKWALALYAFDLILVFILGKSAFKLLPGEPTSLIMEIHDLRIPHFKTLLRQTWFRLKEFIYFAFPLIVGGSIIIKSLDVFNLLQSLADSFSFITINWLGLPAITGVVLIFGILRKELALIMLAAFIGTTNFTQVLSPIQMITFALVCMLYIPCIATMAVLIKEFGWVKGLIIIVFEILLAIGIGGIVFRILEIYWD